MLNISDLESSAALWDWISTVGLIVALLAAITEFITSWTAWISVRWKPGIEKTSALLVLLGAVASLVASWQLSNINGRIVAGLRKEAAAAQTNAGNAMAAAAKAETRLEEAKERTLKVEQSVADANKTAKEAQARARQFEAEIASSNARAEEAKNIAEHERLERVKLEAQVAPRRLTMDQRKAIIKSLKQFQGRTVTVVSYSLDVEGGILATQIVSTLTDAGIQVEDQVSGLFQTGSFWVGVILTGPAEEQPFIRALTTSLTNYGGLATRRNEKPVVPVGMSKLRDKAVLILVGGKPLEIKISK